MRARNVGLGLLTMLILLAAGGWCGKSAPAPAPAALADTVARLHWLGIQRLARETNAAYFMSVLNLPESQQLVAQTLDKLALALTGERPVAAPKQMLAASNQVEAARSQSARTHHEPPIASRKSQITNQTSEATKQKAQITNQPPASQLSTINHPLSTKLRPLLDDLVRQESYLEIQQAENQPGELALAIRLDDRRAELWTSNLTAVLGSMTNVQSLPAPANCCAWRLPLGARPSRLDLARAGEWTLLGMAAGTNRLVTEWSQRIRAEDTPVSEAGSRAATNYWLDTDVDLGRLAGALKVSPPALLSWGVGLPRLAMTVIGAGGEVRTEGRLKFAQPLPFEEAAWNIPTNLVYQPLISFTAARGFQPWLESQKAWKDLAFGAAPNQVFFWAREGLPFLSYCAVPFPNASNCVARLTERLVSEGNAWMTTNARSRFMRSEKTNGIELSAPFMQPYLGAVTVGGSDFVFGGLLRQEPGTNTLAPPELFHEVTRRTNLVCYDWELTGRRLEAWFHIGEVFRVLFFRDRLSQECVSVKWFRAAAPRLGNCATAVTRIAPDQLSFVRRSSIGFSSVELHLLADWLESPQFPRGFHSQIADRPVRPVRIRSGTNSVQVPRLR